MDPIQLATKLLKIADNRRERKALKLSGSWSMLFGAVSVAWGQIAPVDWILSSLGLVLLLAGIWNFAAPRRVGILVDAVALTLVASYNLTTALLHPVWTHANMSPRWALLGALQLLWGARRILIFPRVGGAFVHVPFASELPQIEQSVRTIGKAKEIDSDDLIEFAVEGVKPSLWKALLTHDHAVFVEAGTAHVLVGTRDMVRITSFGKVMRGTAVSAEVAIARDRFKGTLSPESFQLYQQWKTGVFVPRVKAA